jgi:uncharacterized protein YraI/uncharacterized protein YcbK (DUF882 family)/GH24 family phage-related lysozyme (muramidase)
MGNAQMQSKPAVVAQRQTTEANGAGGDEAGGVPAAFLAHLRHREGYRTDVYLDSRGLPTAGVGHLMLPAELAKYPLGSRVPESVLSAWLAADSRGAWDAAQNQIGQLPSAANTQAFGVALGSVNFQLGIYWNTEHKKTWANMRAGKWAEAAAEAADSSWASQTPVRVADFQRALRSLAAGGNGSSEEAAQSVQGNGNVKATSTGTIIGQDINVRSGPGTTYKAVKQYDEGAAVSVYETQSGWVRIAPGQWIKAEFVKQTSATKPPTTTAPTTPAPAAPKPPAPPSASTTPIGTGTITGNDVNVRSGPGTSFAKVGDQLDKGVAISFFEKKDGFLRIGKDKWVSSQFVAVAGQTQAPVTNAPVAPPSPGVVKETGKVAVDLLNVRTGPGQTFATAGAQLTKDTSLPIYEIKDGWLRIGVNRWVFGQHVNYSGNRPAAPKPTTPSTPVPPVNGGGAEPTPGPKSPAPVKETPVANTGTATGTSRAEVTLSKSVGQGGSNLSGDVRKIQQLLKDLGFRVGVSGEMTKNTIGAISAFQVSNGFTADGVVDAGGNTLKLMNGTPGNAFRQTTATLAEDDSKPVFNDSRWKNRSKLMNDGSGESLPKPMYDFMRKLIKQMEVIGANISGATVGSGYRSPFHNANTEGSASRSNHQFGRAVDIYSDHSPTELHRRLRKLMDDGKIHNGGLGLYSWGCHYDIDAARVTH